MCRGNIKILIFDMDGVVLESEPLHENARKMMIQELGLDASREFPEAVGKSSSGFWRQVVEKFHLDGDPNDFEKRQYQYVAMQIKEKKMKPSEGFEKLVLDGKAQGLKNALASSSTRVLVDETLRLLGIRACFDITVAGNEIPKKKPEPDVYLKVLELSGIEASCALAIEDSKAGVEAAQRAGICCYGYRNPTSGNQDISKADKIVNSLNEIVI